MKSFLTRRDFSLAAAAAVAGISAPAFAKAVRDPITSTLAELEPRLGARVGASIHDLGTGQSWGQRPDERFPLCSTFKLLASAAVLARVDKGLERLDRRIRFTRADLVTYSPETKKHAGGNGMTLAALCKAAVTQSDNTAANLILKSLGGPAAFTAYARSLGDEITRLDRWETALNEGTPGDPRDTTSPAAMAGNLRKLVFGDVLSHASRLQLVHWMLANTTGGAKLKAGIPKDWRIGDKTGGGGYGTNADIAVIWPPGRKPVIAVVYLTQTTASFAARNAAIADVGRAIHKTLG